MKSLATLVLITLALAACEPHSGGNVLAPKPEIPPVHMAQPLPPKFESPVFTASVSGVHPGIMPFQGPMDAWLVALNYAYLYPDPAYPHLIVETEYQWGSVQRRNIKVFCAGQWQDDFADNAWMTPLIEYRITVTPGRVINGDWFNGFCMAQPTDYWGSVPQWWLLDPTRPTGTRNWSGVVVARDLARQRAFTITVTNWTAISVTP